MAKNLVIVESPAKAKTIKKFLGSNYKIEASMGHVRDLPKSQLGVDVENDFEPKYITIRGKGELLSKLKKEAKKVNKIYLATDPDREGEAISWHLYHLLKTDKNMVYRITFNEITQTAVKDSIKNARDIDMSLVDAQQARRILDRIVGYKISPLLWKKVKKGLSAGRVQSIALRLIAEREAEIDQFIPEEYWTLDSEFSAPKAKETFVGSFYGESGKKIELTNKEQVERIIDELKANPYIVEEVKTSERIRRPQLPFTTSTLQQEASKKLNFTTSKTMRIAQQLYEGVDVEGHGTIGLISYLRTDSTRISTEAHEQVLEFIREKYGKDYENQHVVEAVKASKTQDAHEAIRPTYTTIEPNQVKLTLTKEQYKLYELIWSRFVSSRMQPAVYDSQKIRITNGNYEFRTSVQVLRFEGYLKVYQSDDEEVVAKKQLQLLEKTTLSLVEHKDEQHFTQPPARFTEASLVKTLEENGVGRPSTYAPTISTILARGYVSKDQKKLFPTELGEIVNTILVDYFDNVVDIDFTANMEKRLDAVEEGTIEWKDILREFYPDFNILVNKAEVEISKIEIKDVETDIVCDLCGANMVIKVGKFGKFLACPAFPTCKNTKPLFEKVDNVLCHLCGGEIHVKKTKKGRRYYACEHHPECEFISWNKPSAVKCKECGGVTVEKGEKLMCISESCKCIQEKES